jgi:hypothetical protein
MINKTSKSVDRKWILLGLLIVLLIGYTITDGIETGQRGGKIYPDNTPPLGPHHWDEPITAQMIHTAKATAVAAEIKQVSCFPMWYCI